MYCTVAGAALAGCGLKVERRRVPRRTRHGGRSSWLRRGCMGHVNRPPTNFTRSQNNLVGPPPSGRNPVVAASTVVLLRAPFSRFSSSFCRRSVPTELSGREVNPLGVSRRALPENVGSRHTPPAAGTVLESLTADSDVADRVCGNVLGPWFRVVLSDQRSLIVVCYPLV